jgi:hypothetical protein
MPSTKDLLEHAGRSAPAAGFELDDLGGRRSRRRRRDRGVAIAVGLVLTTATAALLTTALRPQGGAVVGSSGPTGGQPPALSAPSGPTGADGQDHAFDALPPATQAPLVAADGQFHYRAVLISYHCVDGGDVCGGNDVDLDASYWWSPADDSGRIEVDARESYGIDAGRFGPGEFPNHNGIDVSDFPTEPDSLYDFLVVRSRPSGASPAPLVTPPPDGGPEDGRLWRAITDLLEEPRVTPAVRAALLDVAAGLQGSHVTVDSTDPFGRPAHIVEFGNWGGHILERLYVDPDSHELLCWTSSEATGALPFRYHVVQQAGVVGSTETSLDLDEGSVPGTLLSLEDLAFGSP